MKTQLLIHPEELSRKWIDRMADAGVDGLGIHPVGGKTAAVALENLMEMMKKSEYRALIDYAKARGLKIEYEIHAAGYLLPRTLFDSHPEYFRMNKDGQRTSDFNFCVSDREALALFVGRAAELAVQLWGSDDRFYLWLDDDRDTHCHCPKCSQMSASDLQLTVVNAMQREIRKRIPTARLAYLAYVDTVVVPRKVVPDEGVFLEYAPFEKYTAKSENAAFLMKREFDMIEPLMAFFGRKDAKVLEYWYDNSLFSGWKKPPKEFKLHEAGMKKDIATYGKMGFDCISSFACYLGADYEALYGEPDLAPFTDAVKNMPEDVR